MNNRGLEFAIGTLVVIIFGVVIVGLGILLLGKIVGQAELSAEELFDECRGIGRQIAAGQLLAVSPATQEVKPGKTGIFCGVLRSHLSSDQDFSFEVTIQDETGDDVLDWQTSILQPGSLSPGEEHEFFISAIPSKNSPKGDYAMVIKSYRGTLPYETRLVTVRVP